MIVARCRWTSLQGREVWFSTLFLRWKFEARARTRASCNKLNKKLKQKKHNKNHVGKNIEIKNIDRHEGKTFSWSAAVTCTSASLLMRFWDSIKLNTFTKHCKMKTSEFAKVHIVTFNGQQIVVLIWCSDQVPTCNLGHPAPWKPAGSPRNVTFTNHKLPKWLNFTSKTEPWRDRSRRPRSSPSRTSATGSFHRFETLHRGVVLEEASLTLVHQHNHWVALPSRTQWCFQCLHVASCIFHCHTSWPCNSLAASVKCLLTTNALERSSDWSASNLTCGCETVD